MQNFMSMSVKQVIEKHPRIGKLLEEYEIGCAPCTVATCLLNDVVTIHNLPKKDEKIDKELLRDVIRFIREYADKYHHAKEEDILFDYTDSSLEVIKVILEDHVTGRGHVQAVVDAIETENKEEIISHLTAYQALLTEHIKKEDEILFPWIDRTLTTGQVGELFQKFAQANTELGEELPERNLDFLESLHRKFD